MKEFINSYCCSYNGKTVTVQAISRQSAQQKAQRVLGAPRWSDVTIEWIS